MEGVVYLIVSDVFEMDAGKWQTVEGATILQWKIQMRMPPRETLRCRYTKVANWNTKN